MSNHLSAAKNPLYDAIIQRTRKDETQMVQELLASAEVPVKAHDLAYRLVVAVRQGRLGQGGLDAFLFQYNLSSEEGIALMCLAEALLRIPDKQTVDKLIRDKLSSADWDAHLSKSKSLFVNAATWALMLTGKIVSQDTSPDHHMSGIFKRFVARTGEPIVRQAIMQAMRILGRQFVMGRTIEEGLK
ncbi:MAG: bifunctional proline dehydrogenase/L-glutamate gamma-semialdehyde dehydrogenase, partial [Pseudomonadota bacterium]